MGVEIFPLFIYTAVLCEEKGGGKKLPLTYRQHNVE